MCTVLLVHPPLHRLRERLRPTTEKRWCVNPTRVQKMWIVCVGDRKNGQSAAKYHPHTSSCTDNPANSRDDYNFPFSETARTSLENVHQPQAKCTQIMTILGHQIQSWPQVFESFDWLWPNFANGKPRTSTIAAVPSGSSRKPLYFLGPGHGSSLARWRVEYRG